VPKGSPMQSWSMFHEMKRSVSALLRLKSPRAPMRGDRMVGDMVAIFAGRLRAWKAHPASPFQVKTSGPPTFHVPSSPSVKRSMQNFARSAP